MMKKKNWIILILMLFTFGNSLQAEIELIMITWNAFKCQNMCTPLIENNFGGIQGVKDLKINASAGSATMKWQSKYPFSYEPFRYAAAGVGFSIDSMRIRAKGTIHYDHSNDNIYLISSGDNTEFLLIGPIHTEPGRYTPPYNFVTHPLSPEVRDQLLDAEKNRWMVIISGPLFVPSHFPRVLITEQIKVLGRNRQSDLYYQH